MGNGTRNTFKKLILQQASIEGDDTLYLLNHKKNENYFTMNCEYYKCYDNYFPFSFYVHF